MPLVMELRMVASGKPGKSFFCSAASLSMNALTSGNSAMRSVMLIFVSFLWFLYLGERLCLFKLFLSFR